MEMLRMRAAGPQQLGTKDAMTDYADLKTVTQWVTDASLPTLIL